MMKIEPQEQHRWLRQLIGEWTYETELLTGVDVPLDQIKGTDSVRAIGDLWVVADGTGRMPGGGEAKMQMTLGFDPQRQRFTGTWVGSMMTHLWVYDGELDAAGRVLSLHAEGPSMSGDGSMRPYKDVIEIIGPDERTLTGSAVDQDGKWVTFMAARYRRVR